MHAHSPLPRKSSGFILLHTLWLLLTASAIVSGVLVLANRMSERFAMDERITDRTIALESAVELVVHDLVVNGVRSAWAALPSTSAIVEVQGKRVSVKVQNAAGLVDVGTAEPSVLNLLLHEAIGSDVGEAFARIASRRRPNQVLRPFANYAELQARSGLSDRAFACLFPHITLYSGQSAPTPTLVPPTLANWLGVVRDSLPPNSAMETAPTTAGSTYRIDAGVSVAGESAGQWLSVEVTVTGQHRPSHVVRSWLLLPHQTVRPLCG